MLVALIYVLASAAAGVLSGGTLGTIGGLVPPDVRLAVASLAGVVAVALGVSEVSGSRLPLLQCDRETPKRWVDKGPLLWAVRNGATLGCGAASRLGYWAWYVVPIGSLLVGSPVAGAAIYGTYATVRATGSWLWILVGWLLAPRVGRNFDEIALLVVRRHPLVRRVAAAQLIIIGTLITALIGV